MADVKMLVDDFLLRELSAETRRIGTKVVVRKTKDTPAYKADIMDIIIIPQSEFYRIKFMSFYRTCNQNAVKALKELSRNFSFTPDYNLGIGYVLNQTDEQTESMTNIKIGSEFETVFREDEKSLITGSTTGIITQNSPE